MKNKILVLLIFLLFFSSCKLSQEDCKKLYNQAFEMEAEGNRIKALNFIEENIPKRNRDALYYCIYGNMYRDIDPYKFSAFSVQYLEKAYARKPDTYICNYSLGKSYEYMMDYQSAYKYYKQAENFEDEPKHSDYFFSFARVCFELQKYDEAEKYNKKAQSENINADSVFQEGMIKSYKTGQDVLDEYYSSALEHHGNHDLVEQLYAMGKAYFSKYEESKKHYLLLIEKHPNTARFYSEFASVCLMAHEMDEAYENLKKAESLDFNERICMRNLAFYYFFNGDTENALKYGTKYFSINTLPDEQQGLKNSIEFQKVFATDEVFQRLVKKTGLM